MKDINEMTLEELFEQAKRDKASEMLPLWESELAGMAARALFLETQIAGARTVLGIDPVKPTPLKEGPAVGIQQQNSKVPIPVGEDAKLVDQVRAVFKNEGDRGLKKAEIRASIRKATGMSDEDKSLPVIESTVTSLKNGGEVFGFMFDKTNTKTWWYTPEYTVGEGNHRRIKDGHLPDSKDIKDFTNYELT